MRGKGWVTAAGVAVAGLLAGGVIAAVSPAIGAPGRGPDHGYGNSPGDSYTPGGAYSPGGGNGPGNGPLNGNGPGNGNGPLNGNGNGPGPRAGGGSCPCLDPSGSPGTLTGAQAATLQAMAEDEKLASDLYAAFAGRYDVRVFANTGKAEAQHLTAIRALLGRYGVGDPTAGRAAGTFRTTSVQARYDRLLARGSIDRAAALAAARDVEEGSIAQLTAALAGLGAPDVAQVYRRLKAASEQHLKAFQTWLE